MGDNIQNIFRVVYTTNISGKKKFNLRDRNIHTNIANIKRNKTLLNKGDRVFYANPDDPTRTGMIAKIKKLNFKQNTSRRVGTLNYTQTPREKPKDGIKTHIPKAIASSYDIIILKSANHNLPKKRRKIKGVKPEHISYAYSDYNVWKHGYSTPEGESIEKGTPLSIKLDNYVQKFLTVILKPGISFTPDLVYNKSSKLFTPPSPKTKYKISSYIIKYDPVSKISYKIGEVEDNNTRTLTINVKLFLDVDEPLSFNNVGSKLSRKCQYHWDALKNITRKIRGGKRRKYKKRRTRRKRKSKK